MRPCFVFKGHDEVTEENILAKFNIEIDIKVNYMSLYSGDGDLDIQRRKNATKFLCDVVPSDVTINVLIITPGRQCLFSKGVMISKMQYVSEAICIYWAKSPYYSPPLSIKLSRMFLKVEYFIKYCSVDTFNKNVLNSIGYFSRLSENPTSMMEIIRAMFELLCK